MTDSENYVQVYLPHSSSSCLLVDAKWGLCRSQLRSQVIQVGFRLHVWSPFLKPGRLRSTESSRRRISSFGAEMIKSGGAGLREAMVQISPLLPGTVADRIKPGPQGCNEGEKSWWVTQEAETASCWVKTSLGESVRPYLKQQTKKRWWPTPMIPATQAAEIRRIAVWSQPGQIVPETLSQKYLTQKVLVEWLKMKALSANPRTTKKKKKDLGIHGSSGRADSIPSTAK
jgi:hypothetical protein